MSAKFAQEWPNTQAEFMRRIATPKWKPAWEAFLEGMRTASVRGHKTSRTGNHVDIRVNWHGRSKALHVDARGFEGPYVAQAILGALVAECMQGGGELSRECMRISREWALGECVCVAEVVYAEAERLGIRFARELIEYAEHSRNAPLDAKRRHAMEMAWGEAQQHIRTAIENGMSPEDIIDFVNQCTVESVLAS